MKSGLWIGAGAAALAAAGTVEAQPAAGARWVSLGGDQDGRYYYDRVTVERRGGMIRFRMRAVPQPASGDAFASAIIQVELNCGEQSTRFIGIETYDARGGRIGSFADGLPRPEGIRADSPEAVAYRRLCPRSLVRPILGVPPPMLRLTPTAPPPPPMAPMPPPLVRVAPSDAPPVRAIWRQNPSVLISNEDYPAAALRAEEQGRVAVRLDVSPEGRVTGCTVTASSGSASLDSTTCSLLQRRARFTPARNARGEPVADSIATALVWSIPPEPPPTEDTPKPGESAAAQPPPEQS